MAQQCQTTVISDDSDCLMARCCRCCICAIRCSRSDRSPTPTASSRRRRAVSSRERPTCSEWLEICLRRGFGRSDGPSIVIAWPAVEAADWEAVVAIDEEVTALRASSTARRANRSMGLRLLKTWQGLHPDVRLEQMLALVAGRRLGPTLPVAFAAVGCCGGIARRDALAGYAYTRLAATVSAAMRLDRDRANRRPPAAESRAGAGAGDRSTASWPARRAPESFAPALDIAADDASNTCTRGSSDHDDHACQDRVRLGIGGPVGSGKTALVEALCKRMRADYKLGVITNDIFTREDMEFLVRSGRCRPTASSACRPAAVRTRRFEKTRR